MRLPDEEAAELARRAQEGDEEARARLMESLVPLVKYLASKYQDQVNPSDVQDLVSIGNLYALGAVDSFVSENCDGPFAAWAVIRIRGGMRTAIRDLRNEARHYRELPPHEASQVPYTASGHELAERALVLLEDLHRKGSIGDMDLALGRLLFTGATGEEQLEELAALGFECSERRRRQRKGRLVKLLRRAASAE